MREVSCGENTEPSVFRESENGEGCISASLERFLRGIRVLLVESDDSTRSILAALLRKCSYRVVAVSDGLEAWEVLKNQSHNIDIILTEVELPSISGFALLTLITEHERCKSIPVIMMSSRDSMSTVYKCMLKGAADFLVKPVRRNELRNLWRHVWRRKNPLHSGRGNPQDDDNNARSNRSSNAQTSSTKPKRGAQVPCGENMQKANLGGTKQKHEKGQKANTLNHSHDSAFSWYINRTLPPIPPLAASTGSVDQKPVISCNTRETRQGSACAPTVSDSSLGDTCSERLFPVAGTMPDGHFTSNIPTQPNGLDVRWVARISNPSTDNLLIHVDSTFEDSRSKNLCERYDKEESRLSHEGNCQREAALTKFRVKRKERCFQSKVRYEGRSKLAGQRKRIRGQFVGKVHSDPVAEPEILSRGGRGGVGVGENFWRGAKYSFS